MSSIGIDDLCLPDQEEATERQLAELEFVKCAYAAEEAWSTDTNGCRSVVRLLQLPVDEKYNPVTIELHLQLPSTYPVNKEALLEITSTLKSAPSNPPLIRKAALNALPQLTEACQATAREFPEQEAVWHVFNRADEWIESNWLEILNQQEQLHAMKSTDVQSSTKHVQSNILGRRCIYSHHIIANSKRKDLAALAHDYKLGGYVKIGWPGIIIFEGLESSCQAVVDEIKTWRWQHLSIRVEETIPIPDGENADDYRRLPKKVTELGEDEMSTLAQHCRDAGLGHMFLQCLKIDNCQPSDNETAEDLTTYAALIHVDHMNDRKGYQKWLRKESDSAGCTVFINHSTLSKSARPLIHVGLIGDKDAVKKVLKQWRTSRVDVDSKNKPCLERMMSVLVEGDVPQLSRDALGRVELLSSQLSSECRITSLEELHEHVSYIFGEEWTRFLRSER
jgi:hypothetical protein